MIEATVALLVALVLSFALFVAQEHEATKGARQLEQCEQAFERGALRHGGAV